MKIRILQILINLLVIIGAIILVFLTPLILFINILKWILMFDDCMSASDIIGDYLYLWIDLIGEWVIEIEK